MERNINIRINKADLKKKLGLKDGYTPVKDVDYFDGKDADEDAVVSKVLKKIPKPKNGKDGSPDTPDEIADKLNTLKKKVDWKVLKNVPDFSRQGYGGTTQDVTVVYGGQIITSNLTRLEIVGAGVTVEQPSDGYIRITIPGSSGFNIETPVGAIDGSNAIFTVSNEPVQVVSDGITYFEGAGYSYSGGTITMDVPPSQYLRSIY